MALQKQPLAKSIFWLLLEEALELQRAVQMAEAVAGREVIELPPEHLGAVRLRSQKSAFQKEPLIQSQSGAAELELLEMELPVQILY